MITGDNLLTAIAIGKKLKFHPKEDTAMLEVTNDKDFYLSFQSGKPNLLI